MKSKLILFSVVFAVVSICTVYVAAEKQDAKIQKINVVQDSKDADDRAQNFVEISIPANELKDFINTGFGEKPAS